MSRTLSLTEAGKYPDSDDWRVRLELCEAPSSPSSRRKRALRDDERVESGGGGGAMGNGGGCAYASMAAGEGTRFNMRAKWPLSDGWLID